MLERNVETTQRTRSSLDTYEAGSRDVFALFDIVARRWRSIALCFAIGLALALTYVNVVTPKYTAFASILIDQRRSNLIQQDRQIVTDVPVDSAVIESQGEVFRSENVGLAVVRALNLAADPEFVDPKAGLSVEDAERVALVGLQQRITIKRQGLTYVIQVGARSTSPAKSAQIANAIANAYIQGEIEAKYETTRRGSRWLESRIDQLRSDAAAADRGVQQYKSTNNIVDTSRGLLSEQRLSDVNTQLASARAATAEAKARLDRINQVRRQSLPTANVTDALRSDIIAKLRSQYLDLAARETDLSRRYGRDHGAAVDLRGKMSVLQRSMADEVDRIAQTYDSELKIAVSRENSLDATLTKYLSETNEVSKAQVQLRDLESSAQTARNLYDNFLQKLGEANQQQTLPTTEARIITTAKPPMGPSSPNFLLALGGGSMLGLFAGIGLALGREWTSRGFHSPDDLERKTGIECFGVLPSLPKPGIGHSKAVAGTAADLSSSGASPHLREVVDRPFSYFSETVRNIKVSIEQIRHHRDLSVIGIVSSLPGEGKTTLAANLAFLMGKTGSRVLLLDADLRRPMLSRTLAPSAVVGLIEVLTGATDLASAVRMDARTGVDFLPAVTRGSTDFAAELLSSGSMQTLLDDARDHYDYVVVDFAPLLAVVDAKSAGHLVDCFVMAVKWGSTTPDVVSSALGTSEVVRSRMIGSVLNNADPTELQRRHKHVKAVYESYYV